MRFTGGGLYQFFQRLTPLAENNLFLPSGLYRRYRIRTGSAFRFADLQLSLITAGGESHPALKQIYTGYYMVCIW